MESNPLQVSIEQCRFELSVAERLLAPLDDSHLALEPCPGVKTAGWLIGHLAVTGDFARKLCGAPALCPSEWRERFNPGTQPSDDPARSPSMQALGDRFRAVYDDLCVSAAAADVALLAGPNPYQPARAAFPTAGSFVAYLMTTHLGYHLGQLAIWSAVAAGSRGGQPRAR
jgi:hypothetical protein